MGIRVMARQTRLSGGAPKCLTRVRKPSRYNYFASRVAVRSAVDDTLTADVVIVGAGIVGLFAAQELLRHNLTVALLERKGLCAGATGAGQGYLWMAHRSPGSVGWALAARSILLWRQLVDADPEFKAAVEWQDCGSLLVSTTATESAALSERQLALNAVGLRATFLDPRRLRGLEPGLVAPRGGAGLLVQSDLQINGRAAAHALLARCRSAPGFRELLGPEGEVQRVELAAGPGGSHVVLTPSGRLHARHALVLSAGVWTSNLLVSATRDLGWSPLLQPRRGHLLELPQPQDMPRVVHGMMEMSYTKHYTTAAPRSPGAAGTPADSRSRAGARSATSSPAPASEEEPVDITFTATTSASGSLLIGSSREFSGWDTTPSPAIVAAILKRSAHFLPGLGKAAEAAAAAAEVAAEGGAAAGSGAAAGPLEGLSVRVGLRPYAVGGLPMVGPVQGAPGLFVAAGHEGSGLCMGPATGELLARHIRRHLADDGAAAAAAGVDTSCLDTRSFDALLPDVRRRAAEVAAATAVVAA